jgi:hypothetical protein
MDLRRSWYMMPAPRKDSYFISFTPKFLCGVLKGQLERIHGLPALKAKAYANMDSGVSTGGLKRKQSIPHEKGIRCEDHNPYQSCSV